LPSLLLLAYLLLFLPWGAWRTSRILRGQVPHRPVPSRVQYWRSAALAQGVLLAFAWVVGSGFGSRPFELGRLGLRNLSIAVLAFILALGLREAIRRTRSQEEVRGLEVIRRAPRTREEKAWFVLAALAAGIAEEVAYRGVGWSILIYMGGSAWVMAVLLSVAFALAHWSQGWKSGIVIFFLGLMMHGLVALTDTLVLAMGVHLSYDLVAGAAIRRKAREIDGRGGWDGSVVSGRPGHHRAGEDLH